MSECMKNIDLLNSTENQFVQLQKNFKEFKNVITKENKILICK